MYLRDLKERLRVEKKTITQGDFGQVETWTPAGTIWARVTEFEGGSPGERAVKRSARDTTEQLYLVQARNLNRTWSFGDTRFLWTPLDGDQTVTRVLKPKKDRTVPGLQSRRWVNIPCEDITDKSGDANPN